MIFFFGFICRNYRLLLLNGYAVFKVLFRWNSIQQTDDSQGDSGAALTILFLTAFPRLPSLKLQVNTSLFS
jgi:hypothetical protein